MIQFMKSNCQNRHKTNMKVGLLDPTQNVTFLSINRGILLCFTKEQIKNTVIRRAAWHFVGRGERAREPLSTISLHINAQL